MTLNEYQALAQRTSNTDTPMRKIHCAAMGLCGEAGELIDCIKKYDYQGHAYDPYKLIDEASDVLWYLAELAAGLGITLEDIARHNVDKLRRRYPDGFSAERSIHREG